MFVGFMERKVQVKRYLMVKIYKKYGYKLHIITKMQIKNRKRLKK